MFLVGNKRLSHTHAKYDTVNNRTFFHKKSFEYIILILLERGIKEKELIENKSGGCLGFFSDLSFCLMFVLLI